MLRVSRTLADLEGCEEVGDNHVAEALSYRGFEGDAGIEQSDPEEAPIFFVVRLLRRLQKMASPPAIEYEEYARALQAGSE